MRILLSVLIIVSFLESTIIPFDLVLIILICRSLLKADRTNFYLALFFGLAISHLKLTPLGLQSISYLVFVQIAESLSKSRLSSNVLLIIPVYVAAVIVNQVFLAVFTYQTLEIVPKIYGAIFSLPIFYLVRFWEERFIVKKEIKLKI